MVSHVVEGLHVGQQSIVGCAEVAYVGKVIGGGGRGGGSPVASEVI